MAKLRPEDTFLTVALSVIGVVAVAGYLAIIAPTYDKEDRIPTPEEYALSVKSAAAETEARTDTLYALPETERTAPETEPPAPPAEAAPPAETEAEPEPSGPAETTLEEWFAMVEERTTRKLSGRDETPLDEGIEKVDTLSAADAEKDSAGASISWGVSSTDGEFFNVMTDENSSVTVTRTEDGYSSTVSWSDGEGTSSFSGFFTGDSLPDWLNSDSSSEDTSGESPFRTYDREETEDLYIINTNPSAKKIHLPGGCSSVDRISDDHYATTNDLTEYLADGYTYCGNCFR